MNKTECLIALDDLRVAAWEYRDRLMKIAQNESWEVIHDAPKGLIAMAVNMAIRTCDRFTFRLNDTEESINLGLALQFDDIVEHYAGQLADNVERYNAVLNKIGGHAIKLTHNARFRKSYVRS